MQLDDDSCLPSAVRGRSKLWEASDGSSQNLCVERQFGCQWFVGSCRWAKKSTPEPTPQLRDVNFRLDSLSAQGHNRRLFARSPPGGAPGLTIRSLSGRLRQQKRCLPQLALKTPHLQLELTANTRGVLWKIPIKGDVDMFRCPALASKMCCFLPEAFGFRKEYRFAALTSDTERKFVGHAIVAVES